MTSEEYVKLQDMWIKATGVKKGSWVKVLRSAENRESGWLCNWCATPMDKCVGKPFRVVDIHKNYGLQLDIGCDESDEWSFPFFILEPTEAPKPEKYEFKPFEQVLVRDYKHQSWRATLFIGRFIKNGYPFGSIGVGNCWRKCIPYAGHEHLLGTSDEPEDWEKYYDKE